MFLLAAKAEGCVKVELVALSGTYDLRLLAMCGALAILMPYAGFEVVERARAARGLVRRSWILAGGTAVGVGLCGALDCGICALTLPVPIRYHYPTTGECSARNPMRCRGSFAATREYKSILRAFAASCVVGMSGAAISYLCLKSWRMPAIVEYRWGLCCSYGDAVCHIASSSILSRSHPDRFRPHLCPIICKPRALLAGIAFCVLSGTVLIATLYRVLSSQEAMFEKARERESFFNGLAEAIPGIVWIANSAGETTYINKHWYELTGTDPATQIGSGWVNSVHPDDRQVMVKNGKPL